MRHVLRGYWVVVITVWLCWAVSVFVRELPTMRRDGFGIGLYLFAATFYGIVTAILAAFAVAMPLRILLNLAFGERRRTHRKETLVLVGVLAAGCGWAAEHSREIKSLAPPSGVTTFEPFVAAMPAPSFIRSFRREGRIYVAWYGDFAGPIAFPSGPACYLFDDRGTLVDWQPETGDGGHVEHFLESALDRHTITMEQAQEIVQRSGKDRP